MQSYTLGIDIGGSTTKIVGLKEIKQYITKPCYIIVDREEALTKALDEAQPGELVITTGKGIESTQRINGTFVQCHSDAQVIEHWLTEHPEK